MTALPLSAHIGYLFTELPLEERIAAARKAGFDAIEHPQPFAIPADRMVAYLKAEGLTFSQMAAATGNASRGEKGLTALLGREADFRQALEQSLDYAEAIGCPFVHPMAGVPAEGLDPERVWEVYLRNLEHTAERCATRGIKVLVEAISTAAVPGYFMSTMDLALRAADIIGRDRIHFLIDTFHARATGFDAEAFIAENMARIGHVHIADHPGRHEPGTGSVDFMRLLAALKVSGYEGAIGFEYIPRTNTDTGLGWLPLWEQLVRRSP
jgi:2-dehydrotetronate isomerase